MRHRGAGRLPAAVVLAVSAAGMACADRAAAPGSVVQVPVDPGGGSSAPSIVVDTGPLPDGRLTFEYEPSGSGTRIYTMRFDGSELRALSPAGEEVYSVSPVWSPNGTRLAYWGADDAGAEGVWVVRDDGSARTLVASGGAFPFWLDDARIGYACPGGLCVAAADGSQRGPLLQRFDQWYRVSPDGRTIAFTRTSTVAGSDVALTTVFLMNPDGTGERRLTSGGTGWSDAFASWSPDGQRLAFISGRYGIAVATADGREIHGVAGLDRASGLAARIGHGAPAWSPDGRQIVFGADPRELYVANADGTGTIRRIRATLPSGTFAAGQRLGWSWTAR